MNDNLKKIAENAFRFIPFQINPNIKEVQLNVKKAVSNMPQVAATQRENNYPIIVVPGVMGSKLFQNIYSHGEERRFYRTEKKIIKSST